MHGASSAVAHGEHGSITESPAPPGARPAAMKDVAVSAPADIGAAQEACAPAAPRHAGTDAAATFATVVPLHCTYRFTFTGSGREYFRVWIVNLCFTLLTLGLYSPWAKVRRLQYFARHTRLDGAVFDFHGDPRAILKGRLVALVLLAAWHYAFSLSLGAGLVIVGGLALALPLFLRSALRFRLANTSHRGLRFGFDGSIGGAYRAWLPMMAVFMAPTLVLAIWPLQPKLFGMAMLAYLAWPWIHAGIKRYQHGGLRYADCLASAPVPRTPFVIAWLVAAFAALGIGLLALMVISVTGSVLGTSDSDHAGIVVVLIGTLFAYAGYLLAFPIVPVWGHNASWSATAFPGVRIESSMTVSAYMKLEAVNVALTVLTLGLFRPFAAVRGYRYRLATLGLSCDGPIDRIVARAPASPSGRAHGDAASDLLSVDLSW